MVSYATTTARPGAGTETIWGYSSEYLARLSDYIEAHERELDFSSQASFSASIKGWPEDAKRALASLSATRSPSVIASVFIYKDGHKENLVTIHPTHSELARALKVCPTASDLILQGCRHFCDTNHPTERFIISYKMPL